MNDSMRPGLVKREPPLKVSDERMCEIAKLLTPANRQCKLRVVKHRKGNRARLQIRSRLASRAVAAAGLPQEYFEAAWLTPPSLAAAALAMKVAEFTVRQWRHLVAAYLLERQLLILGSIIVVATMYLPAFCITREAWDETGQSCIFRLGADATYSESRGRWEIMIYRCSLFIGWPAWSGHRPVFYEFLLSPVVLPTTCAANVFYSLRGHKAFMRFQAALNMLRNLCRTRAYLMESDAAYSNEKLVAHFLMCVPPGHVLLSVPSTSK